MSGQRIDRTATLACLGALGCWSLGPVFIEYLTGQVDSWTQNALRYSAACLFWLPFLLVAIRSNRFDHRAWRRAFWPLLPNLMMQSLWARGFEELEPGFMVLLTLST